MRKTVSRIVCSRCGETFDQNRDKLGDPYRCPSCGEKHNIHDKTRVRQEVEQKPQMESVKEYVYLIYNSMGNTKIGISTRPSQRLKNLQIGSAYELKLLATRESDKAPTLEKSLHEKYEKYHVRGEWFDIPKDELNALVQRFKNE